MHTMDYADTATTRILSSHILPITDLTQMLSHIEETLPPMMHLPVSSEDMIHFYSYLHTHVLIANWQLLLLIDVLIQDHSQKHSIYKIFTLDIPHGNFAACYGVNTQYIGVTQDETMVVEISQCQFSICQEVNGQFCNIHAPFQPLTNPPSCITALYAKNAASISTRYFLQIRKTQSLSLPSQIAPNVWILTTAPSTITTMITLTWSGEPTTFITVRKPIHILWLQPACRATLMHFHLPPQHEHPPLAVNVSLDMANINIINMPSLDFHIWQHLEKHQNELQHLANIPSVPVNQLYKHMINGIQPITPFTSPEESTGDTDLIWTLFSYKGVYGMAIRLLVSAGLGIFYCYFFWCQPARLAYWPLQPGTTLYTIVGDDVKAAAIYKCDGRAKQPTRPCKIHGLHMEWVPTWMESWHKQQMQSLVVPACRSLESTSKIQGTQKCI